MSEGSKIEWCHHSFSGWWGCAKVSPACDNCYAERDAGRYQPGRILWGVDAERRAFGDNHWNEPLRWNRRAAARGERYRVFVNSMADTFDKNAPPGARERLWGVIAACPSLDFLLLTKRIGNAPKMVPAAWMEGGWPANAWPGSSVVTQEEVDRDVPKLLELPARVRFLSCEPMLGPLDLRHGLQAGRCQSRGGGDDRGPLRCGLPAGHGDEHTALIETSAPWFRAGGGLQWVIAGGESGPKARPLHPDWPRGLRDQCAAAGVAFLHKQNGEFASVSEVAGEGAHHTFPDGATVRRVGKKLAGRLLDGVQHDGYPA